MARTSSVSTRIALVVLVGIFGWSAYRSATTLITLPEARDFTRRIRPPLRDLFTLQDAGSSILMTVARKRSVGLFGLSGFSFRLPGLIGVGLLLGSVFRIWRMGSGLGWLAAWLLFNPLSFQVVEWPGSSRALAFALWTWALECLIRYIRSKEGSAATQLNAAGILLGLSAAADVAFVIPGAALIVAFLIGISIRRQGRWIELVERTAVSLIAITFVMQVLPVATAAPGSLRQAIVEGFRPSGWSEANGAKSVVATLRQEAAGRRLRIGASAGVQPILAFYQASFRIASWELVEIPPQPANLDYYVSQNDGGWVLSRAP